MKKNKMINMNKYITKKLIYGLIILMMIQSCTLYKGPVSLEEAYKKNIRTKVFTKYGERIIFKSIIKESDKYYGVSRKKKDPNVYLDINSIEKVQIVNKSGSAFVSILVPVTFIAASAIYISNANFLTD